MWQKYKKNTKCDKKIKQIIKDENKKNNPNNKKGTKF